MPFEVTTEDRCEIRDVTDRVDTALELNADGVCTAFCQHTTAGLAINEADSRLLEDVVRYLGEIVVDEGWAHDELDGNADSHLRTLLLGPSVTIPVSDGSLDLGTWQSVLLVECDGPRTRQVEVRH